MKYRSLELFAGAGGLALGLEQSGFLHAGLVEIDKNFVATLRKNQPNWNIINEDIITVINKGIKNYLDINNIDLVSGGFPCQPFSYAGNKLGLKDSRGNLFYYFAKVVEQVQPKMFLAENVKGLLTHDKGKTFKLMLKEFENLGYKLYWQVLNAADCGVAQKRQRLILIGIKNSFWYKDFIFPIKNEQKVNLKEALKNVPNFLGATDRFYEIVTGDKYAFYKLCNYLPVVIDKVLKNLPEFKDINKKDIVIEDLKHINEKVLLESLFKLSFSSYYGWNNKEEE